MISNDVREPAAPTTPAIEQDFIDWLRDLPDPLPALRVFARHYHYFSANQVVAFARLFTVIPRADREALAVLAEVLYEELGNGKKDDVHSVLLEEFAAAAGVSIQELPLPPGQVADGVRWYVCELEMAFGGRSLPRALATYCFLESSAVATYGPLLDVLRATKLFTESQLTFFARHATIESEHAAAAQRLAERARLSAADRAEFDDQWALLRRSWAAFWRDIWDAARKATR